MALRIPLSHEMFLHMAAEYVRSFRLTKIKIKTDYTLFENKEADLRIIYWKNTGLFYVKYLGAEYYVTGSTIGREYRDDVIYGREPIEYVIQAEPDEYRLKTNKPLLILVNFHPAVSTEGAVALVILEKKRLAVDQILGITKLNIEKFIRVPDIEKAMEQAFLETPSILASIASETPDEEYAPWIEAYIKNNA